MYMRPLKDKRGFEGKLLLTTIGIVAAAVAFAVFHFVSGPQLRAQLPQTISMPLPSFEVASVKLNRSEKYGFSVKESPGRFTTMGTTANFLIAFAYGVREFHVSGGPDWTHSERYDIDAKIGDSLADKLEKLPPDEGHQELRLMLQSLLADRFKLTVHQGTKVLPIYELVIAKNGPRLKEAKPGDTYANGIKGPDGVARAGMISMRPGQFTGQGIPIASLVRFLSQQLQRTILDKTGLTGKYNITLQWTPEEGSSAMFPGSGGAPPAAAPPSESSGPSIFTALQEQLGMKLEPQKGPVDIISIDHIERPSEN
jgi:uncharacterized protein (TIGR03435 family)